MRVTCTGALRSARAANRPANPPPTITTRRDPDVSVMTVLPFAPFVCSGCMRLRGRLLRRRRFLPLVRLLPLCCLLAGLLRLARARSVVEEFPQEIAATPVTDSDRNRLALQSLRCLGERGLELLGAAAVDLGDGLLHRAGQRRIDGVGLAAVINRDDAGQARRERGLDLLLDPFLHPVPGELPGQAAGRAADEDRSQQRRGEQAHDQSHATADRGSPAPQVVAGFLDRDLSGIILAGQHYPLYLNLLALHQLQQPVEVLLGPARGRVRGDDDVKLGVTHARLPSASSVVRPAAGRAAIPASPGTGRLGPPGFWLAPVPQ